MKKLIKQELDTEPVERFRLDALRKGSVLAMQRVAVVVRHLEDGYIEQDEVYYELIGALEALATGLKEGVLP